MGKHLQLALSIVTCALALAPAAIGQTPEPLLPQKLGGVQRVEWKAASAVSLESVADDHDLARLLREYGCQGAEHAIYRGTSPSNTSEFAAFRVTVYTMSDRSSAYGAFSLLARNSPRMSLGESGTFLIDGLYFYQSQYFVHATGHTSDESLQLLARQLAGRSGEQASLPLLPDYLPEEGFVKGSDAYVLGPLALSRVAPLEQGDWAGFAYGAEVQTARYRIGAHKSGSSEATLLLLSYPTPHIARARLADFQRLFNLNGQRGSGPAVYAKRKSTLVVLVDGVASAEEAARLIGAVRFQQEVSWSEPTPVDDREIVSGLIGIFLGTGAIVIVTLGLGLAFGAARLLLMSTLPGRVFDKPVENDVIFLNLQNPK